MLTKADDYPIHQTPEPIAYSGTDRNFYDRYFFNGYEPNGDNFFALAFGVYPHLNIMDASFSFIDSKGRQHCLHASKVMHMERMDIQVGPISIEVVEPLKCLRILVNDVDHGIKADLLFKGRMEAFKEPRFTYRNGPRTVMDLTRLTQCGSYEGWVEIDGNRIEMSPETYRGTRDRSWGVRSIGMSDPQPAAPVSDPQFYWLWAPLNFEDRFSMFHRNDNAQGQAWNSNAVVGTAGGANNLTEKFAKSRIDLSYKSGTRHIETAKLFFGDNDEVQIDLHLKYNFYMRGIGYMNEDWGHGVYRGELEVGYEVIDFNTINASDFQYLHVQAFCNATLHIRDEKPRQGCGVLEQAFIGAHEPSGFKELFDLAK